MKNLLSSVEPYIRVREERCLICRHCASLSNLVVKMEASVVTTMTFEAGKFAD